MNGTVIDIQGITVNLTPISMEDSTDVAYILTIKDGIKEVTVNISYGKITETWIK